MRGLSVRTLLVLLLLAGSVLGEASIDTLGAFTDAIRQTIGVESTALLPDSALDQIAEQSILWTSVDIGGVEAMISFYDTAGTKYYAVPDTIVSMLYAGVVAPDGSVWSLKAWYPQFFEELGLSSTSSSSSPTTPYAYIHWADTIQLLPTPSEGDALYIFRCFVEHQDISSDGDTIRLKPAYTEAAKFYACHLACISIGRWEEAAQFKALYDDRKANLKAVYTRRLEVLPQ